jgi:peptidoglycan-associated lipoprotein
MRSGLSSGIGTALAAIGACALLASCQTPAPRKSPSLIQSASTCADFTVSIYFEARSATVTREADALIKAASKQTHGCAVSGIDVLGLADAPGDPDSNLELSQRRATAVTKDLQRRGFGAVEIKVSAAGDLGAQNRAGQDRPWRRRADVMFHIAAGAPGA